MVGRCASFAIRSTPRIGDLTHCPFHPWSRDRESTYLFEGRLGFASSGPRVNFAVRPTPAPSSGRGMSHISSPSSISLQKTLSFPERFIFPHFHAYPHNLHYSCTLSLCVIAPTLKRWLLLGSKPALHAPSRKNPQLNPRFLRFLSIYTALIQVFARATQHVVLYT